MSNKKAIELSLNFIITLIISIIVFGFGVKFISDLSSQAIDLTKMTTEELDRRVATLICEGSERVCIGIDHKTIKRKEFDVFGVEIINILDTQDFSIIISPSDPIGYKINKLPITSPPNPNLIINPEERSIKIEKNEEAKIGIGVQVPANAVSGTYILNVEILTGDGEPYSAAHKLYVNV